MKIYFILLVCVAVGFVYNRSVTSGPLVQVISLRTYLAFAAAVLVGFFVHNALLFIIVSSLSLLCISTNRIDNICRLVILVVLIPAVTCKVEFGGLYLFDLDPPIALTIAALITCGFSLKSAKRDFVGPEALLVLSLMFIMSVAATRDASSTGILRECVKVTISLYLPFYVFTRYVKDSDEISRVIAALGAAAIILAVVAIYEARFHWALYDVLWRNQSSNFFMSRSINIRAGFLRTPTSFRESTSFAVFQTIGVLSIFASRRFYRNTLLWILSICLGGLGLLAAQSRGADISLCVGVFCMMLMNRRFMAATLTGVFAGISACLLLVMASSFPRVAEFLGQDRQFGSDADYRQTLLRRGVEEGMKHPFFGQDMTHVGGQLRDLTQGEGIVDFVNTPLVIFLSAGLVGLLVVFGLTIWVIKAVGKPCNGLERPRIILAQTFISSALVAEWTALCFTSFWERNPYWLMILIASARVSRLSVKRSPFRTLTR